MGTGALAPPAAHAETAADGAPTEEARARFKEGVKFYDHGKYEQARVAFLQAYALTNHVSVLMNLAWSCLKAGHPAEAERYFHKFMSESKDMTDKQIADATEGLNQAQGKIGHIAVNAPAGAVILLDGAEVGTAPLSEPVSADPGNHSLRIRGADASDAQTVAVTVGHTAKATLRGKGAPSAPAAAEAAEPSRSAAPSKSEPETPTPEDTQSSAASAPAASTEDHPGIFAAPKNATPIVVLGTVAVVGYAGLVTGLVLKSSDQSKRDDVAKQLNNAPASFGSFSCDNPPNDAAIIADCKVLKKDDDAITRDNYIMYAGLGVGVAGTVAAVIYWMASTKGSRAPTTGLVVAPMAGPGTGGITLSGAF